MGLSKFYAVTAGIAEINGTRAIWPVKVRLYLHIRLFQPDPPSLKQMPLHRKADMPRPDGPMNRNGQTSRWRRFAGLVGAKDEHDCLAAPKKDMPALLFADHAQPQNATVERFCRVEIININRRLEYGVENQMQQRVVQTQTPLAGIPVRTTGLGAVRSFHWVSARFTAPFGGRLTNWPWPSSVLIAPSSTTTLPRDRV
jgi:hypothetical protein